jgi:hypothetical protein
MNAYRTLVEKPLRNLSLGSMRVISEDNIKFEVRELDCEDRSYVELAQGNGQSTVHITVC